MGTASTRARVHRRRALGIGGLVAAAVLAALPAPADTADIGQPDSLSAMASVNAPAVRTAISTEPDEPDEPDVDRSRALLISDSAWLGIKLYGGVDSVQGFEHTLALASCRRRVSTSCTNFDGFVPITLYEELDAHPEGFETLIVATGYNDSDNNLRDEIDAIVNLARTHGYSRIVWMTLRANVSYTSPGQAGFAEVFERTNATLADLVEAGTYPEMVLADWATYARDRPEWFASDGIHLRRAGPFAAGDYISRKIAHLDGVACAQPESAGTVRVDPCPDPDVRGPVVDIDSLYPVGEPIPPEPFVLSWEGSSSWPEPPWWEAS